MEEKRAGIETRRKTRQSRERATRDAAAAFAWRLLLPVTISRTPRLAWRIRAITGEFFSRGTIDPRTGNAGSHARKSARHKSPDPARQAVEFAQDFGVKIFASESADDNASCESDTMTASARFTTKTTICVAMSGVFGDGELCLEEARTSIGTRRLMETARETIARPVARCDGVKRARSLECSFGISARGDANRVTAPGRPRVSPQRKNKPREEAFSGSNTGEITGLESPVMRDQAIEFARNFRERKFFNSNSPPTAMDAHVAVFRIGFSSLLAGEEKEVATSHPPAPPVRVCSSG